MDVSRAHFASAVARRSATPRPATPRPRDRRARRSRARHARSPTPGVLATGPAWEQPPEPAPADGRGSTPSACVTGSGARQRRDARSGRMRRGRQHRVAGWPGRPSRGEGASTPGSKHAVLGFSLSTRRQTCASAGLRRHRRSAACARTASGPRCSTTRSTTRAPHSPSPATPADRRPGGRRRSPAYLDRPRLSDRGAPLARTPRSRVVDRLPAASGSTASRSAYGSVAAPSGACDAQACRHPRPA